MNESEMENNLRRLSPAPPSAALERAIAAELAPAAHAAPRRSLSDQFRRWLDRLCWSGLGAAAAFAVMLLHKPQSSASNSAGVAAVVPAAPPLQKVLTSDEIMNWEDEGVHFDANGQPVLKLRRMAVEHQAWADFQNAGVVQVEVPRQEVVYVPVALQ